jgi:hypothetical protein
MTYSTTTTIRTLFAHLFVCALALSTSPARAHGQDSTVRHSSEAEPVQPVTHDHFGPKVFKKGTLASAKLIQDTKTGVAGKVAVDGLHEIGRRGHVYHRHAGGPDGSTPVERTLGGFGLQLALSRRYRIQGRRPRRSLLDDPLRRARRNQSRNQWSTPSGNLTTGIGVTR